MVAAGDIGDAQRAGATGSGPVAGGPLLATPTEHRFPWYVRLLLRLQRRRYGAVLESARLWGRTPRVFAAQALLYGMLDRRSSPLAPELRSLVTVRVSQINWCAFCVDLNSATVLERGGSAAKLAELASFESSALFTEREKAALAWAEAMTRSQRHPARELLGRLRRHFDDDAIIELSALVAFQNLSSKFNAALGVAPQGFCAAAPPPGDHGEAVGNSGGNSGTQY